MINRACRALALLALLLAPATLRAQVTWLAPPARLVTESPGYIQTRVVGEGWQGVVANPEDPIIVLSPVRVQAGRARYLYLTLAAPGAERLQLFYGATGQGFAEERSRRWALERMGEGQVTLRLDMGQAPGWQGMLAMLRVDLDGAPAGAVVRLERVGVSARPVSSLGGRRVLTPRPGWGRYRAERMAAWHQTIVAVDERRPQVGLLTYVNDRFTYSDLYLLAKLAVGVEVGGKTYWPDEAWGVEVDDFPGGVRARYRVAGVQVTAEIVPLLAGREPAPAWEGAALLRVSTDPPAPVLLRAGGGQVTSFQRPERPLQDSRPAWEGDTAQVTAGVGMLHSSRHPLAVAMRGSASLQVAGEIASGQWLQGRTGSGRGWLVMGFAGKAERARALAGAHPGTAARAVEAHYRRLLAARIETPVPVIDQAFRAAIINLEYNWLAPYGWTECIHHWLALWHMQHTAGCEWLGWADRSRLCTLTTAAHLFPSGAVPQFTPDGHTRRDFGGSNQFFAWQVRHYWRFAADREALRTLAPALERVVEQTWQEYDPEGDGLLCWGQQIGNQEDYVSTPHNGATPSIEGANMLRTQAMLARALGRPEQAERLQARSQAVLAELRRQLWLPDLGRFAFQRDPLGQLRYDGQYHTYLYPAIWDICDPAEAWSSVRHFRDRLAGERGEAFCSNNFPCHVGGTWGMQAGAAQQPWAAMGLAAVGLRNEAWRPLRAAAEWVMDENHRGAWPEIAQEPTPAYFSPPAGLYVQAVVEALFGLDLDRPAGVLTVRPCFPDAWPSARLELPAFAAGYSRSGNVLRYTVRSREALARHLRWALPPCLIRQVTVDGKPMPYRVESGVGVVTLSLETKPSRSTTFRVSLAPVAYRLEHPASLAEGDYLRVIARGCRLLRVHDPAGVLASVAMGDGQTLSGTVRQGLLAPYQPFGRLGLLNFSRRTFFVHCELPGGASWLEPVTVAVLPRYEAQALGELEPSGRLRVLIRNNTSRPLDGRGSLRVAQQEWPLRVKVASRAQQAATFSIPADRLALFSPGDNQATLTLPGGSALPLTVTAGLLYRDTPGLADEVRARMIPLPLPESELADDVHWRDWREFYAYGHQPWASSRPPLEALTGKGEIRVPGLEQVPFRLQGRRLAPISHRLGRPALTVPLQGIRIRKLYLLVVPFLDNHDTFAQVGRVEVRLASRHTLARTLHFPGDLDWWCPQAVVGDFETAREPRDDRFALLPMLRPHQGDWAEGRPPSFPQPRYWATCRALRTDSAVLSVIEVDLGRPQAVQAITLSTVGVDPALGLVAITGERPPDAQRLAGTPWQIAPGFREPRTLWRLDTLGDTEGWRLEGEAFSVAPVPHLFAFPTLNSLARAGERVTGRAISPQFVPGKEERFLRFRFQGGQSAAQEGPGALVLRLVDARTGEPLEVLPAPISHTPVDTLLGVSAWQGRPLRLELVDESTAEAYAWIGIREVTLGW